MVLITYSEGHNNQPRHIKNNSINSYNKIQKTDEEIKREKETEEFGKMIEEQEREKKRQYRDEMFQKYNTTDWNVVKQKKQKEYEERCEQRKRKEKEKEEWWEKNKDRIMAEKERRHQDYIDRCAQRDARHREAAGKPIPGAWRTANRPDGW